jgi:DNA-directed RNA polymerase specialized sigma24 family protein
MTELEGSARGVSLRAAASMVAGDERDPGSGRRLRHAVDAQLRRAGVAQQDAGDVRTEVVLALLSAPAADLPLPLELACARVSAIARNKAIDHGRRHARAPLALGDALPEPPQAVPAPGSLADGLDEVAAAAHVQRVRADLATALARLDAQQLAAISAHAEGGAARAAGLPRSTYYRALGHAQALLQGDLRGRLAGLGALGGIVQRAREILTHVEAVHAAAAAATAAVAISAAVAIGVHDEAAHHFKRATPVVAQSAGGRARPPAAVVVVQPARALRVRVAVAPVAAAATAHRRVPPAVPCPTSRSYDPSTYDC